MSQLYDAQQFMESNLGKSLHITKCCIFFIYHVHESIHSKHKIFLVIFLVNLNKLAVITEFVQIYLRNLQEVTSFFTVYLSRKVFTVLKNFLQFPC